MPQLPIPPAALALFGVSLMNIAMQFDRLAASIDPLKD